MNKNVQRLSAKIARCDRRQHKIQQLRAKLQRQEEALIEEREQAREALRQLQQHIPAGRRQRR